MMVVNTWVVVIIQGDGERTPVARRSTRRAAYREIDELRSYGIDAVLELESKEVEPELGDWDHDAQVLDDEHAPF
jgi:hypothetical protein